MRSALRATQRVALGTDGYPAKLADELAALRAHEADDVAQRRAWMGVRICDELFDATTTSPPDDPRQLVPGALADVVGALIADREARSRLGQRGRETVDGRGVERLAEALLADGADRRN